MTRRPSGFSMIELSSTLVVLAVLAAIATPGYRSAMARHRATSGANALLASILLTRSEAIRRDTRVALCRSADGRSCTAGSAEGWDRGVLMFEDDVIPNRIVDEGERILRYEGPLATHATIQGNTNVKNAIVYGGDGRPIGVLNGTWSVVVDGDVEPRRSVIVNVTGRPRVR